MLCTNLFEIPPDSSLCFMFIDSLDFETSNIFFLFHFLLHSRNNIHVKYEREPIIPYPNFLLTSSSSCQKMNMRKCIKCRYAQVHTHTHHRSVVMKKMNHGCNLKEKRFITRISNQSHVLNEFINCTLFFISNTSTFIYMYENYEWILIVFIHLSI